LITYDGIKSPIGPIFIAAGEEGVVRLSIGRDEEEFLASFPEDVRLGKGKGLPGRPLLVLSRYFAGERVSFSDIPLALSGTPFQESVWRALVEIPYGEVRTYKEIAAKLGNERAARAVGGAVGANPVAIIVPCHRVVAVNGLGGFGAGLAAKEYLLRLEGAL
jgi:methylated-DNA-[protein]-cysteine S-methyltransferase